jgi:hypothetical protein
MFIKGGVLNGIDNIAKVRSPLFTTKKRGFALEALKHSQDIMDLCITHAFGKTALKFGTLCVRELCTPRKARTN